MAPYVLRQYLQEKLPSLKSETHRLLWAMLQLQEPLRVSTELASPGADNVPSTGVSVRISEVKVPRPRAWQSNEDFHALFEVLRSHLLAGESVKLGLLYPSSMVHPNEVGLLDLEIDVTARSLKKLDSQLKRVSASVCASYCASVVVPAPGNPGFDVLIPFGKSGRDGLFIENRFSEAESKSTMTITDIKKKHGLLHKACEDSVPGARRLQLCFC